MGSFSKLLPKESLPKWQVALIVSIPVAFGLGYLYYKCNVTEKQIIVSSKVVKEKDVKKEVEKPEKVLTAAQEADKIKNEGNTFFRSGDYNEAVRCYTEAIAKCPENDAHLKSTFFQNRAAAYERLNDLAKVIEDCTTALNLNKRYVKAMLRRAKAAEKQNDLNLALEDLATACLVDGFQDHGHIAELDRIAKAAAARDVEEHTSKNVTRLPSRFFIKTYVSTYQYGSALDKLDPSDEIAAKLVEEFKLIEQALLSCENIESKCEDLIEKCEEASQELIKVETLLIRATYYILSKQNSKAFVDLEEIIKRDDVDKRVKVNALIKRGTAHQHQGDNAKRDEDFKKAMEVDENNPDIYHHLGQIHLILENTAESVDNFRKAVALDPDFPVTVVQHCYAEFKYASTIQDTDNIFHYLKEFQKILERFPGNIECLTLYAQVLTERQEYEKAEKLFNEAIQREPKHAALLVHKALLVLQWKAEIEPAKKLIHEALELDNDCEFAYETIATIEMQMGNFSKAVEYFNEAIKRFTSLEELYHLFCVRNTSLAQIKAEQRVGRPYFPGSLSNFS